MSLLREIDNSILINKFTSPQFLIIKIDDNVFTMPIIKDNCPMPRPLGSALKGSASLNQNAEGMLFRVVIENGYTFSVPK